ncbi:MAG: azurin [Bacteroidota bacterium]
MMKTVQNLLFTMMVLVIMISVSSCGAGSGSTDVAQKYTFPSALPADAPVSEVVINGNDQMRYDKEVLTVKSGSRVKLTLNHAGKISKEAMGHNVVILQKGVDLEAYASAAMKASGSGYIPEGDEAIAYTRMIGGGQSTTIRFDAPAPGTYEFVCTYPGHSLIMKGKFIVEE